MPDLAAAHRAVTFTIPGQPVAKARPRAGRNGFYTPRKTAAAEHSIAWRARVAMCGRRPFSGPVAIHIAAYFAVPKNWPRGRRIASRDAPHLGRPDLDNVVKAVLDGCNAVAFGDDAQVYRLTATKRLATEPRVVVTIEQHENGALT